MKTIKVPYIAGLEKMGREELLSAMETGAARDYIGNVNWPGEFPYMPVTAFDAARSDSHIFISYFVKGLDLKAEFGQSNETVWQDSCVEFFVKDPAQKHYHNFEFNCIGTCLASRRSTLEDRVFLDPAQIDKIIRHTSLERETFAQKEGIFTWGIAVGIPFELFGIDPGALPQKLRANFYKCGDGTAHPHYVSWSPIAHPTPNFHLPEFFGELELK